MPPKTPRTLWHKLVTAVKNDPQKAAMLTVLVAILVVLQVRLQMSQKDGGPSRAVANTAAPGSSDHAPAHGTGGSGSGSSSGSGSGGATDDPFSSARPQDAATALRAWMDAPSAPLTRNLFAIELERFPYDANRVHKPDKAAVGFWDELAKSMSFRADVRKERQILVENLARQASELRLQSTIMGASPKAVIDGGLVGEGDVVASFRVLKIEPRRIIVEREGIKLEIQMK